MAMMIMIPLQLLSPRCVRHISGPIHDRHRRLQWAFEFNVVRVRSRAKVHTTLEMSSNSKASYNMI
eukprot:11365328-Heterocapsa_arctica.AAC.1